MDRDEQFKREKEEWETFIGQSIIAFGEIELVTHRWLAHSPRDAISNAAGRLPFAKRVDLILEILEGRDLDDHALQFVISLKRAKKLAETRNDIAHNPVMLNVFVHEASGDVLLEQSISHVRADRVIDLEQMKEFTEDVKNLASAMWGQIMNMTKGDALPFNVAERKNGSA
jgi:hypothetical protein